MVLHFCDCNSTEEVIHYDSRMEVSNSTRLLTELGTIIEYIGNLKQNLSKLAPPCTSLYKSKKFHKQGSCQAT